jgi:hypothetical protein
MAGVRKGAKFSDQRGFGAATFTKLELNSGKTKLTVGGYNMV